MASTTGWPALSTLRADGTVQSTVVNAGVVDHPVSGDPVAAFVGRPATRKIAHLRRNPTATLLWRAGWAWVAAEGSVDLVGPDDPLEGVADRRAPAAAAARCTPPPVAASTRTGPSTTASSRLSAAWPCCSRRSRIYVNP